jgi:hypothetical protein
MLEHVFGGKQLAGHAPTALSDKSEDLERNTCRSADASEMPSRSAGSVFCSGEGKPAQVCRADGTQPGH